jgi:glycerol-3-phosphate dehydrogenase (NAD(P)+)
MKKITVLGAGSWGTAIAHRLATLENNTTKITLYGRNRAAINHIEQTRINEHYLPNLKLHPALNITNHLAQALDCDCVIIATPLSVLSHWLDQLKQGQQKVINLSKGVNAQTQQLPHEMARAAWGEEAMKSRFASLFGPSFAHEVATGLPCALTLACSQESSFLALCKQLSLCCIRTYWSHDLIGVELGGALKNVMAIAAGIADGLNLGQNARAALITRGLAEIHRLIVASGGQTETVLGLAGVGDLVLTATGNASRNRTVGLRLAQGQSLTEIIDHLGHVAEGVLCAHAVWQRAQTLEVEMPIVQMVCAILQGRITPKQALVELLERNIKKEF